MSIARIRKNDTVIAISGEYAGQTGKVLRVDQDRGRVIVEGLNLVKKSVRRTKVTPDGGFVDKPAPLHLSVVMPFDADRKKGVRITRVRSAEKLARRAKGTGKLLD
jgi:large subunit ribosomal protein L24